MPTLFRFLIIMCTLAALTWGSIMALAILVVPTERDIVVRVPPERLNPPADNSNRTAAPRQQATP